MTNDSKVHVAHSVNAPNSQKYTFSTFASQANAHEHFSRAHICNHCKPEEQAKGSADQAAYKRLHLFSIKRCHRSGPIGMHEKPAEE